MMNMDSVLMGGMVKRYHTVPTIGEQLNSSHMWGVAVVYLDLCPNPTFEGLKECLYHDCAEHDLGDAPYQAKQKYPDIKEVYNRLENLARLQMGIPEEIDDPWIKVSDMFELVLFAVHQLEMGNRNYLDVLRRGVDFLKTTEQYNENEKLNKLVRKMGAQINEY